VRSELPDEIGYFMSKHAQKMPYPNQKCQKLYQPHLPQKIILKVQYSDHYNHFK
jgi:hypothetical protein